MATQNVGGLFQYTSRADDVGITKPWKPGDSWADHDANTGFDDRDRELEDYLGSGITTRRFLLVDTSGNIVAEFTPNGTTGNELNFRHLDTATTDSFITWSTPAIFGAGTEQLYISGPEGVGQVGVPPAIVLSRTTGTGEKLMQVQGASLIILQTTDLGAGAVASEIDLTGPGPIDVFASVVDFWNLSGAAHCEIKASAFTVVSTERAKVDIEPMDDARLLAVVGEVRAHRFRNRVRPQSPRHSNRERGENTADHDCSVDGCTGTREHPCTLILNDTHRIGLIAEHVYGVAPEITNLDADHKPDSLAVDQVASVAFGAVGALLRKVEALEARIAALEGVDRHETLRT